LLGFSIGLTQSVVERRLPDFESYYHFTNVDPLCQQYPRYWQYTGRFGHAALPELVDKFGGNVLKHCRRQANIVEALEPGDGDRYAVQAGLAGIGLEIAELDGSSLVAARVVGVDFLLAQQSVENHLFICTQVKWVTVWAMTRSLNAVNCSFAHTVPTLGFLLLFDLVFCRIQTQHLHRQRRRCQ